MVDDTPPPPGAPGPPDRRRPAPTIDLKATEIASRPLADGPKAASSPPPDQDTGTQVPPGSAVPPPRSEVAGSLWPLIGAGFAGALLALVIGGGLAFLLFGDGEGSNGTEARVAGLERQVADLAGRAPTDPASAASLNDLARRLQNLEARVTRSAGAAPASDPALAERIAALEAQLKSLGDSVDGLKERSQSAAAANAAALEDLAQKLAHADASGAQSSETSTAAADANAALIAALTGRLDAVEAGTKALAEQEKRNAENSDDRALRIAIVAEALEALVERGRPFAAELKAAQALASDPSVLAPLEAFAATGVPNPGILARELNELEPELLRAAAATRAEGSILDKLASNAERLVRIRPIEAATGDDPAAILSRVEFKAVRGDLPGALAELGSLPESVRAPAQPWIVKAQSRATALAASRAFAADALAALAQPSR